MKVEFKSYAPYEAGITYHHVAVVRLTKEEMKGVKSDPANALTELILPGVNSFKMQDGKVMKVTDEDTFMLYLYDHGDKYRPVVHPTLGLVLQRKFQRQVGGLYVANKDGLRSYIPYPFKNRKDKEKEIVWL